MPFPESETIDVEIEDNRRLFEELGRRSAAGGHPARLAAVFHNSLAQALVRAARRPGVQQVVLSGGCFQNRRLLESCFVGLREAGLRPYANQEVPAGDSGLSLGQAVIAACS